MGKHGLPPTPTEILKLRGSWRAKLNPNEPQPPRYIPDRPDWMDDTTAQVWDEVSKGLHDSGLLTSIDGKALARYCKTWAMWRDAHDFLDEHGTTYPTKDVSGRVTGVAEFPQVSRSLKLADQLLRLEQQFGMTPSARTRIEVKPKEKKTKLDDFKISG